MKIACIYYDYPPFLLAGSEVGAHEINKWLVKQGHQVTVYTNTRGLTEYEGIELRPYDPGLMTRETKYYDWIFSQFQWVNFAADMAKRHKKKAMLFFHTCEMYGSLNNPYKWDGRVHICYNSEVLRGQINYRHPYTILIPPVFEEKVKTDKRGEHITLINCGQNKGGDILIRLAQEMPDLDFMGVKGGYSRQIMDYNVPNIWYVDRTNNPKLIYGQTKILIVPSGYESWGRVIHEAMINGIPVIATPNPGVKECGGDAVVYLDRMMLLPWMREIRRLMDDPEYYKQRSEAGLKRAAELNAHKHLKNFERYLNDNRDT